MSIDVFLWMINEYALIFLFHLYLFIYSFIHLKGVPLCMRALSTFPQLSLNLPDTEVM